MRLCPSFLILTIAILGCSTQGGTQSSEASRPAERQYDVSAPDFELKDIHGKYFSLSGMKGKVVFLDFWATWCPPCVLAVPEVEKLHEEYKDKNVEIISLSLDNNEEAVHRFMSIHKMTSRVAIAQNSNIDTNYGVEGIPTFFIIDKEGKIANSWEGFSPRMVIMWRKEMDRLLGA